MPLASNRELGAMCAAYSVGAPTNSSAPLAIIAASTGDNTAVTGQTIDRLYSSGSGVLVIAAHASLTVDKVLTVAAEIQESSDGSNWDTAEALYTATTVVSGTGEKYGVKQTSVSLKGRKRYIRFNFTPNLTATGTDTAVCIGAFLASDTVFPAASAS